jgi:hypothetical protein
MFKTRINCDLPYPSKHHRDLTEEEAPEDQALCEACDQIFFWIYTATVGVIWFIAGFLVGLFF